MHRAMCRPHGGDWRRRLVALGTQNGRSESSLVRLNDLDTAGQWDRAATIVGLEFWLQPQCNPGMPSPCHDCNPSATPNVAATPKLRYLLVICGAEGQN